MRLSLVFCANQFPDSAGAACRLVIEHGGNDGLDAWIELGPGIASHNAGRRCLTVVDIIRNIVLHNITCLIGHQNLQLVFGVGVRL